MVKQQGHLMNLVSCAVVRGEPLMTSGGGNLIRGEVNRNERAPQCGVATIEVADAINPVYFSSPFPVAMTKGSHLFPYRTQKLSPSVPMVLDW